MTVVRHQERANYTQHTHEQITRIAVVVGAD